MQTRTRVAIATLVAVAAWAGMIGGEFWLKCRVPDSEGCIWAKAYFPGLSVPLYGVMIGVPVFCLAFWLTGWWRQRRGSST